MNRSTVIITGASKGLGAAMAKTFASAGHQVIGLYAKDEVAAGETRSQLAAISPDSLLLRHDTTLENMDLWERPEIQSASRLILINNAAANFCPRPFHLQSWQEWESAWRVAVQGSWRAVHALLRPMLRSGQGVVVNVLTSALQGMPPKGFAAYCSAKQALRGLTLALAAEYAERGLKVFSISPGFMETPLTAAWDERFQHAMGGDSPRSTPAQIAQRLMELLASPDTRGGGEDYAV